MNATTWPVYTFVSLAAGLRFLTAGGCRVELPAVNQIEAHIGWHNDQLTEFCHAQGIVVQAGEW